ncbi:PAS domain S-box protein [uncultured Methanobacterium sp.]|uniref:PAS domain S-box protein n=1 Tax=uncultured Methanobacterium sp. TaxID=176306 RepID=UPI002AA92B82|nr:PAS domain S-box protein [uncultured Methanobacterium sp.]
MQNNDKINLTNNLNNENYVFGVKNPNQAILIHDFEGNIVDVNEITTELTGYSKNELLQMKIFDMDLMTSAHEEIWSELKQDKHLSVGFGQLNHRDGKIVEILANNCLLNNDEQDLIFSAIFDITHHVKIGNMLKESDAKYKSLFELNPDYTVFINPEGKILDVNDATLKDLGHDLEHIKGLTFTELGLFHPEDEIKSRHEIIKRIIESNQEEPFIMRFIDKNGKTHCCQTHLIPIKVEENLIGYQGVGHDITELKMTEEKLKNSLAEKETLLREIHHRVKNNMQIISSLLSMETQYVKEEETVNVLKESQNRIRSMAMVHEKLYQSQDLTNINIHDYILSLVSNLFYSYHIQKDQITLVTDVDDIKLNLETAMPCGLIICELVSNSLKYAFPEKQKGKVEIIVKLSEDTIHLTICDDGIGLPNKDYLNEETLGLQLVQNLTNQLDGTIKLDLNQGTKFEIFFKESEYKTRT